MPDQVPNVVVIDRSKPWWQSRTLWFNAACLVLAGAEAKLGVVQGVLPGDLYTWLAFVLPLGNAALRAITNSGLTTQGTSA